MSTFTETPTATALAITISDEALTARLSDGRIISAPLVWFPRLVHGTADERKDWRLIGNGVGIHWSQLDEDISVESLLAGKPSAESQSSLKKWLEQRAKS